jgi:Uma2 family endonuclease
VSGNFADALGNIMASVILPENEFRIPSISSLDDFRRWMRSDEFPERGRIDYVDGHIEVDMSPEDLFTHGTPKGRIYATLLDIVEARELGYLFCDCTRVTCIVGGVSVEPDIVLLSDDAIDSGRVRLIPKVSGGEDRYVEIEGPPELIVEVVSDSSERKDKKQLPAAYFAGGVAEFWLVDARSQTLQFQIYDRNDTGFRAVEADADGFQRSSIFKVRFRLERSRNQRGRPVYTLHVAQ